jgi:hypothetical protein
MKQKNENITPKNEVVVAQYLFREADLPEPIETIKDGRVKYGKYNLHPQFLYGLYYGSPIHGGIINQKVTFISGNGLEGTGIFLDKIEEIDKATKSKFSLDELVEGFALDLEVLEYYYILFKKDIVTGVWYADQLSGELMRPMADLKHFEYSEDWSLTSQSLEKTGYKLYKSIFEVDLTDELVHECVMYVKTQAKQIQLENKKLTSSIFPIPSYSGALTSIMADIEMNWFHYAEVVNGWSSNTILNLNDGIPANEDEKKKILKEIKEQSTDKKKKGGMTVFFNDGKERAASVEVIGGNNNDVRYILTQEHLLQSIMIGESVQTPALFGLEIAGKLGGTVDLSASFARFQDTYGAKRQKKIAESLTYGLKFLNAQEDLEGDLVFKPYTPIFSPSLNDDNKVATALNSFSPLLANAILGVLTDNEKRSLASLPPVLGGDVISKGAAFSTDSDQATVDAWILSKFLTVGQEAKTVEVLHSDAYDFVKSDSDVINDYTKVQFAIDLTDDQKNILSMVKNGESFGAINSAVGKGGIYLARNIVILKANGLMSLTKWEVTKTGAQGIVNVEALSVVYSYEERPDAPPLVKGGTSRDFCKTLIAANRVYTRQEVDSISGAIGRDVWLYRGGWYHDPNTDRNQPSCRHYWKQNVISVKN